jgi:hypothetical protein
MLLALVVDFYIGQGAEKQGFFQDKARVVGVYMGFYHAIVRHDHYRIADGGQEVFQDFFGVTGFGRVDID